MAKNNYNSEGQSSTDKALDKFTELMIEKIEHLQGDWKKPWFTPGVAQAPHNLSGRNYNGSNALMLMMQAEKMGYDVPVWGTFDRIIGLNYSKGKEGRTPLLDKDGNKMPFVSVNKGEKSFPVFLTTFTVINQDTKEKIPYDDYKQMSKEEQKEYNVYPKLQTFYVFNVAAQTNIKETRPELYEKLKAELSGPSELVEGEKKSHPAIDKMIDDNLYFCPIKQVKGDEAYYSISKDEIVVPTREQFIDGESFASNTLHECAHATGASSRLDRLKMGHGFGSAEYAKEELTAELSAAVVASQYGLTKHVKNDSAAYLKSWLNSLQESPDFLKTVLNDVKRCTSMLNQRIEAIQLEMGKGEKADFSQFMTYKTNKEESANLESGEIIAAKNIIQDESHYHRSR